MNKELFSNLNYDKKFLLAKCCRKIIYYLQYVVTLIIPSYFIFSFHPHPSYVLSRFLSPCSLKLFMSLTIHPHLFFLLKFGLEPWLKHIGSLSFPLLFFFLFKFSTPCCTFRSTALNEVIHKTFCV